MALKFSQKRDDDGSIIVYQGGVEKGRLKFNQPSWSAHYKVGENEYKTIGNPSDQHTAYNLLTKYVSDNETVKPTRNDE